MGRQVGITANNHAQSLFDKNYLLLVSTLESLSGERGIFYHFRMGLACIHLAGLGCLIHRQKFKSLLQLIYFMTDTQFDVRWLTQCDIYSQKVFFLSHFRPVTYFLAWCRNNQPLLSHLLHIQQTPTRSSISNRWLQPDNKPKAMRKMNGRSIICS